MFGYKMTGFPPCEDKDKKEYRKYAIVYSPVLGASTRVGGGF